MNTSTTKAQPQKHAQNAHPDAWGSRAEELAQWALARLFNRLDRYGGYHTGPDGTVQKSTRPAAGARAGCVTTALVAKHFRAKTVEAIVGAHALGADSTGLSVAIDIDAHGDDADPAANLTAAIAVYDQLDALGIPCLLTSSNGKGGYHVRGLFAEPVPGAVLFSLGQWLLRDFKAWGLAMPPESFPKSPCLTPSGPWGTWLRLPGRHHTRNHWSEVWDGSNWLEGAAAVAHLLGLEGADPSRIPAEAAEFVKPSPPRAKSEAKGMPRASGSQEGEKPGEHFERVAKWADILEPAGWVNLGEQADGVSHWQRPGKDGAELSATLGHCKGEDGSPRFFTFSPNGGLPERVLLNKFATYAHLNHRGDFPAAASALRKLGYGSPVPVVPLNGKPAAATQVFPSSGAQDDATPAQQVGDLTGGEPAALFTDLAAAEAMVQLHGHDLRYSHAGSEFLVWDGKRWEKDTTEEATRRAKRTAKTIRGAAVVEMVKQTKLLEHATDDEKEQIDRALAQAKKRLGWAGKLQQVKGLNAMLTFVRSEPGIPVSADDLDADAYLLNTPAGTVNLKTGEIRSHRREDHITQLTRISPDFKMQTPTFDRFLNVVFPDPRDATGETGNPELIGYVQKLLGYSITGDVSEHVLPILHGPGGNGKGTLIDLLQHILGDYASVAPRDLLSPPKGERHPTELADLYRKRLVAVDETRKGGAFNDSLVKFLTGGGRVKARLLYKNFIEFDPTHQFLILTNHKPKIDAQDPAMRRRVALVPFVAAFWNPDKPPAAGEVRLPSRRRDRQMFTKLKAEGPGVLAWLVRGCLGWQAKGLEQPAAVAEATDDYFTSQDLVGRFVSEECIHKPGDRDYSVSWRDLLGRFEEWRKATEGDGSRYSAEDFRDAVLRLPGVERYTNNGVRYRGIALQTT